MLHSGELRLAEEHLADGQAVEPADEPAFAVPNLDRMRITRFMGGEKRLHHPGRDPVERHLARPRSRTGLHHPGKVLIEGDRKLVLPQHAAQIPAEMGSRRIHDGALLRAPPLHRADMADREDAALVVGDERIDGEIVADANEPTLAIVAGMLRQQLAQSARAEEMRDAEHDQLRHERDALGRQRIGAAEHPSPQALRHGLGKARSGDRTYLNVLFDLDHSVLDLGYRRSDAAPLAMQGACRAGLHEAKGGKALLMAPSP